MPYQPTSRERVMMALMEIPMGQEFTIHGLLGTIKTKNAPTPRQTANYLQKSHYAVYRDGGWYREDC